MTTSTTVPVKAWVADIMGMPISVHVRAPHGDFATIAPAVAAVFDDLRQVDQIFSPYRSDSDLTKIRAGQATFQTVSPLMQEVFELVQDAKHCTAGAFEYLLPDGAGGVHYDPIGVVKGWAMERAVRFLTDVPQIEYGLNAGGDVIVGAGPGAGTGPDWQIGLLVPGSTEDIADVVALPASGAAMATSGNAARGAHIYQPTTGKLIADTGSITVVGPSITWCDIWATALFVGGADLIPTLTDWSYDYQVINLVKTR